MHLDIRQDRDALAAIEQLLRGREQEAELVTRAYLWRARQQIAAAQLFLDAAIEAATPVLEHAA